MSDQILLAVRHSKELLGQLFGTTTLVKDEAGPMTLAGPAVCGEYVDEANVCRARIFFDLSLANAAGAALCMIPAGQANEATKKGEVPENIFANVSEVLNICTNIYLECIKDRLIFSSARILGAAGVPALLPAKTDGRLLSVQIPKYSAGKMIISLVPRPA